MGLSGISIAQLTILLVIVLAVFGTKKLRTIGEDLGKAVKSFREAMNTTDANETESKSLPQNEPHTADKKPTE